MLRVPDDEIELDRRVEWTRPHVTLFGGLSTQENRQNTPFTQQTGAQAQVQLITFMMTASP